MANARQTLLLISAILSLSLPAHADDAAAAEALFNAGKQLLADGQTDPACDKFAESQRLDPSAGTLLNLADCRTKQGRTASAWADFLSAARLAKTQGRQAMREEAMRRAAELKPQLAYLIVRVAAPVDGQRVTRDAASLRRPAWGTRLPVDPGDTIVEASAPGYQTFTKRITVHPGPGEQTIEIPALQKSPIATSAPPKRTETKRPPRPKTDREATRDEPSGPGPWPWVLTGVGAVSVGIGTFFGLSALSSYDDATTACPSLRDCEAGAIDARDRAGTQATIANLTVGVGLVAVVAGVVWWATGTPSSSHAWRVSRGFTW